HSVVSDVPSIMVIYVDHSQLRFDRLLQFDSSGRLVRLRLRGIIYHGTSHFTSRFIDATGMVWFNDGITTGRRCTREQQFD
ncbi:hypothetical protein C8R44DRAFT_554443, partial [Mycena epipterygia]